MRPQRVRERSTGDRRPETTTRQRHRPTDRPARQTDGTLSHPKGATHSEFVITFEDTQVWLNGQNVTRLARLRGEQQQQQQRPVRECKTDMAVVVVSSGSELIRAHCLASITGLVWPCNEGLIYSSQALWMAFRVYFIQPNVGSDAPKGLRT